MTLGSVLPVPTLDDVADIATSLPEVEEEDRRSTRAWRVGKKVFAWERAFRKVDLERFGSEAPPTGPILAVRVDDLSEKEAVLASDQDGFFTIPHFDGYPAVLIRLEAVEEQALREAIVDGWLACAPKRLTEAYVTD